MLCLFHWGWNMSIKYNKKRYLQSYIIIKNFILWSERYPLDHLDLPLPLEDMNFILLWYLSMMISFTIFCFWTLFENKSLYWVWSCTKVFCSLKQLELKRWDSESFSWQFVLTHFLSKNIPGKLVFKCKFCVLIKCICLMSWVLRPVLGSR